MENASWLTRNIRPLMVANLVLIANLLVGVAIYDPAKIVTVAKALQMVPSELWMIIGGASGLYTVGRSVEKVKGAA